MRRPLLGLIGLFSLVVASSAQAQIAPPPRNAPRVPVKSEVIAGSKTAPQLPPSRLLQGAATVVDAETLLVEGFKVRLYGVVSPQLGSSFGPQARAVVDSLVQGPVTCKITDRQKDGPLLAQCQNEQGRDFAAELLGRGLAVTARGTIGANELGKSYVAIEQAAQNQKLGLWATSVPSPVSPKAVQDEAAKIAKAKQEEQQAKEKEKAEIARQAADAAAAAKMETSVIIVDGTVTAKQGGAPAPTQTISLATSGTSSLTGAGADVLKPPSADDVLQAMSQPAQPPAAVVAATPAPDVRGFFERFQLMITGLLALLTTLCVIGAYGYARWAEKRQEIRSVAAALRGELSAARSICKARVSKIQEDESEKNIAWPRIRTLVFQAYIGRLGMLGADLSRQIASIYGQASDYASYYRAQDGKGGEAASKRRALESLIRHIDEVNPRLSQIEKTGRLSATSPVKSVASPLKLTAQTKGPLPLAHQATPAVPPTDGDGVRAVVEPTSEPKKEISPEMASHLAEAKNEIVADPVVRNIPAPPKENDLVEKAALFNLSPEQEKVQAEQENAQVETLSEKKEESVKEAPWVQEEKPAIQSEQTEKEKTPPQVEVKSQADYSKKAETAVSSVASAPETTTSIKSGKVNFTAPIFEKMSRLKAFAASQIDRKKNIDPLDYTIPDYANLTDEELEALLYAEEEYYMTAPSNRTRAG